jgi:hypothetical protein
VGGYGKRKTHSRKRAYALVFEGGGGCHVTSGEKEKKMNPGVPCAHFPPPVRVEDREGGGCGAGRRGGSGCGGRWQVV